MFQTFPVFMFDSSHFCHSSHGLFIPAWVTSARLLTFRSTVSGPLSTAGAPTNCRLGFMKARRVWEHSEVSVSQRDTRETRADLETAHRMTRRHSVKLQWEHPVQKQPQQMQSSEINFHLFISHFILSHASNSSEFCLVWFADFA